MIKSLKIDHLTKIEPYITVISSVFAVVFLALGFYFALFNSPSDYQQGEFVRIMYVHVPSAWMALGIYSFIGLSSISYLIWRNQLMDILARKSAITGTVFTFIALTTGSLWGKPIWGTWWVWDARLTSMLILFFFYLGYIALCNSVNDNFVKSDAPAVLAIVGLINIPIIKFSVNLWTTLHQPASVIKLSGPSIHSSMLLPLSFMFIACVFFFVFITMLSVKTEILQKKLLRMQYI